MDLIAAFNIQEDNSSGLRAAGQSVSVGAESYIVQPTFVELDRSDSFMLFDIPKNDFAVLATRSDFLAVRAERDAIDSSIVARKGRSERIAREIPQDHVVIIASCG